MDINDVLQKENIEYLKNTWKREIMVPVYGNSKDENSDYFCRSYLIPLAKVSEELNSTCITTTTVKPGCIPKGENYIYERFGNDEGIEPIVIERDFQGLANDKKLELVEDFRLLFNLYYDEHEECFVNLENNCKVAYLKNSCVTINQKYLRLYLGFKNKALVLFEDNRVYFDDDALFYDVERSKMLRQENSGENYVYSLVISDMGGVATENKYFSSFYGKVIMFPAALDECGIWPYDKPKEYCEFKIGQDADCKEIKYTCDPSKLSNMFNSKNGAPSYLTPVFFRKEVLDKYRKDDRYIVEDGIIRYGSIWALYVDNRRDDEFVSAYLGDLGRDLPNLEEQQYWASFNVVCDAKLSKVKFQRDFMAVAINPTDILSNFQLKYDYIKTESKKVLGWSIYRELTKNDEYVFKDLFIPSNNSQSELDNAVLLLAKLLIDAIDVNSIKMELSKFRPDLDMKSAPSIRCLEEFLKVKNIIDYTRYIKSLRNIQDLRSSGSGHIKGENYDKVCKKIGIDKLSKSDAYRCLLKMGYKYLCYIEENLNKLSLHLN